MNYPRSASCAPHLWVKQVVASSIVLENLVSAPASIGGQSYQHGVQLQLLGVSKLVHSEAAAIFYAENAFTFFIGQNRLTHEPFMSHGR